MPRRVQDIIPAEHRSIRDVPSRSRSPVKEVSTRVSRSKKSVPVEDEDFVEEEPVNLVKNSTANKIIKKPISSIGVRELENETDYTPAEEDSASKETFVDTNKINIPAIPPVRRIPVTPPSYGSRPKRKIGKWPFITVGAIVIIVVIGYFASVYYSQATFTIVPKVIPVAVNSTYVAQSTPGNGLNYEVITLKSSATTTVPAISGPVTNTKATGKVTFYNNYSNQTVRLIAGTRLTGDNGLIYKLSSSVIIPGFTKTSSSATVNPGKVSANIIADEPGQNYNLLKTASPTDLKIVAYNGTPKSSAIYARIITDISGGFSGVKKTISPAVTASSTLALKTKITSDLVASLKASVPDGFLLYDNSYVTTFSAPIVGGNNSSDATIAIQGTIYGITFPKNKMVEVVAGSQTTSLFSPFSFTAPGLESLAVTITNLKDFSPIKKGALVVRAKGDIKIIGTIPVEEIKKKLAGISLSGTQDVFKSYSPVIESGSGELAPPWAKIPTDLSRVKVVVEKP